MLENHGEYGYNREMSIMGVTVHTGSRMSRLNGYGWETWRADVGRQRVVIVDDLIATGGTIQAITGMVEQLGGQVVKICFVMELAGLSGREKLKGYSVDSIITYEGK